MVERTRTGLDINLVSPARFQAPESRKYGNIRSWSELCQREFASKAEMRRGEALRMLEMAGQITDFSYQPRWILSEKPRITYTADFRYWDKEARTHIIEDVKGVMTEASRLRIAWLRQKYGLVVTIIKVEDI